MSHNHSFLLPLLLLLSLQIFLSFLCHPSLQQQNVQLRDTRTTSVTLTATKDSETFYLDIPAKKYVSISFYSSNSGANLILLVGRGYIPSSSTYNYDNRYTVNTFSSYQNIYKTYTNLENTQRFYFTVSPTTTGYGSTTFYITPTLYNDPNAKSDTATAFEYLNVILGVVLATTYAPVTTTTTTTMNNNEMYVMQGSNQQPQYVGPYVPPTTTAYAPTTTNVPPPNMYNNNNTMMYNNNTAYNNNNMYYNNNNNMGFQQSTAPVYEQPLAPPEEVDANNQQPVMYHQSMSNNNQKI
ncbi:hypothetical protein ABK040_001811 [Willaertia magna]